MPTDPDPLALVDVAVVDGDGRRAEHRTVVIAGGRVRVVGPAWAVPVPPGARVWRGAGTSVLPGFLDAHVHLGLADPAAVVRGGVTFVRDLGWPPGPLGELLRRAAAEEPLFPGLAVAGQILTAPGGYPTRAGWAPGGTGRPVADLPDAQAAVDEMAGLGSRVIKVALEPRAGPTLPLELLAAVVRAAERRGLQVGAHLSGPAELAKALDAGVAELVHWPFLTAAPPERLIRRVAERMTVVPTLHIEPSPARVGSFAAFVAAGGRVVYGTDLGNAGPPPGIDLTELGLLRAAGLTAGSAIAAATGVAATHLGLADRGQVTPGALADLLVVDGDPVEDLTALGRIRLVLRAGRAVG